MAKSKQAKINNESRRKKEVFIANANSGMRGQFSDKIASALSDSESTFSQPKKLAQRLHINEIKKDLIKTVIFAVMVVLFLIVLKTQGLELNFGINK